MWSIFLKVDDNIAVLLVFTAFIQNQLFSEIAQFYF